MARPWNKDFPKAVQVETASYCNARCTFCPYPETSKLFKGGVMNDGLFGRIVEEIAEFQPVLVAPYMSNEPLIDKKIVGRIKALRNAVPDAYIDISTNASMLTPGLGDQLLSDDLKIDEFKINFASSDAQEYASVMGLNYERSLANVRTFHDQALRSGFERRYRIIVVGAEDAEREQRFWEKEGIPVKIYSKVSRGGAIATKHQPLERVVGCKYNREKEWIHVLHDGKVTLCCMDWYQEHVLGDLTKDSIHDVWNSETYRSVRARIADSADKEFICNKCEWGKPYQANDSTGG